MIAIEKLALLGSPTALHLRDVMVLDPSEEPQRLIATDGYCLLVVDRALVQGDASGAAPPGVLHEVARLLNAERGEPALVTTVERLLEWTGPAPGDWPCGECEGRGTHPEPGECGTCRGDGEVGCVCGDCGSDHMKDCDECGGTGKGDGSKIEACEGCNGSGRTAAMPRGGIRGGYIAGVDVDMRRLARLCAPVSGPCKVWAGHGMRALVLQGEGWSAVLMGIRYEVVNERFQPTT